MTDRKLSEAVLSLRERGTQRPFLVLPDGLDRSHATRDATDAQSQIEARYRGLLEAVPDAMLLISQGGKIILLNHLAEEWFGFSHDELLGLLIKTIIPEGLPNLLPDGASEPSAEHSQGTLFEVSGKRKDGSRFPLELMLTPLDSSEGPMTTAAIRDISVRKDVEKHLEEIEERLLELKREEQLKDEFVATVSHELRTPLTSISGSLGLLMGQTGNRLPESAMRLIEIAHRSSQRLVRLVSDILDLQKMEQGLIVYVFKRVELHPLIEATIEANRGYAESYGVQVRLDDSAVPEDVRADSDRLTQAITNLLSNAIKFSPRGGDVTIATEERGDCVRLSVSDHGPGIPADFASRIFQKFSQADASHSRPKDGTGLGLSIVKQIVERLDGEVGFEDAPGGGTVFYIDLPTWEQGARMMRDPNVAPEHHAFCSVRTIPIPRPQYAISSGKSGWLPILPTTWPMRSHAPPPPNIVPS
jgi:PAS domain S-box-containing protein